MSRSRVLIRSRLYRTSSSSMSPMIDRSVVWASARVATWKFWTWKIALGASTTLM